ncbi:hypothetical protein TELCIR_03652, partial [Teladorsagia circumcincta]
QNFMSWDKQFSNISSSQYQAAVRNISQTHVNICAYSLNKGVNPRTVLASLDVFLNCDTLDIFLNCDTLDFFLNCDTDVLLNCDTLYISSYLNNPTNEHLVDAINFPLHYCNYNFANTTTYYVTMFRREKVQRRHCCCLRTDD